MEAYKSTYELFVNPTQSQQYWDQTNYAKLNTPKVSLREPSRPKKNKRKNGIEDPVAGSKLRRNNPPIICTRFGG